MINVFYSSCKQNKNKARILVVSPENKKFRQEIYQNLKNIHEWKIFCETKRMTFFQAK